MEGKRIGIVLDQDRPQVEEDQGDLQAPEPSSKAEEPTLEELLGGITPRPDRRLYLDRLWPERVGNVQAAGSLGEIIPPISPEGIRETHGGGKFKLTVKGPRGKIIHNYNFTIPGPPRLDDPAAARPMPLPPSSSGELSGILAALQETNRTIAALAQRDPTKDLLAHLELFQKIAAPVQPVQTEPSGTSLQLAGKILDQATKIAEKLNPGEGGSPWIAALEKIVVPLVEEYQRQSEEYRRRLGQPPRRPAPPLPPASSSTPPAPAEPPAAAPPGPPVGSDLDAALSQLVKVIRSGVENDHDPEFFCELCEMMLPDAGWYMLQAKPVPELLELILPLAGEDPAITSESGRAYLSKVLERLKLHAIEISKPEEGGEDLPAAPVPEPAPGGDS